MGRRVPLLAVVSVDEEVVEVVEAELGPAVGEVGRRSEGEDASEVFVVFVLGLVGFSLEAEPDSPLVDEQAIFDHNIIS